jgi:iron(III) transport system ATP-binding protein
VTHDQEEAMNLSDRIAVMNKGRIVEVGTPTQLYLRPRKLFTARFIGNANVLSCTSAVLDGGSLAIHNPDLGVVQVEEFPEDGAPTHLMLRPEAIEMLDDGDNPACNVVSGQVAKTMFSGHIVEYDVLCGQTRLRVHTAAGRMFRVGDRVRLHLPPHICVLIGEGAGSSV